MYLPFAIPQDSRVIDLSHPIHAATTAYPGDTPILWEDEARVDVDGYALRRCSANFHTGTHVDAPAHFLEGGRQIHKLEPAEWMGLAWLISAGPDTREWGPLWDAFPPPPEARFLLLHTGWDRHYGTDAYYEGHPVLDTLIAERIADSPLIGLGMDMPSPDQAPYPVHQRLLGAGKLLIENMRGLDRLPTGLLFPLLCIPLPLEAEASWVRPLALLPPQ